MSKKRKSSGFPGSHNFRRNLDKSFQQLVYEINSKNAKPVNNELKEDGTPTTSEKKG